MEENKQHLEALNDIRQMMKQSNRFLSLSGLSGIFAGVYALIGACFGNQFIREFVDRIMAGAPREEAYSILLFKCLIACGVVLGLSLTTALIFSLRRVKKTGQKLLDHTGLRLLINLLIPLGAGGVFCLAMLYHSDARIMVVAPGMLIFYGLALVNGSKYTLHDIRYLGCMEIALGLIACVLPGFGLILWAIGFGVLHIIYGSIMWYKYERH